MENKSMAFDPKILIQLVKSHYEEFLELWTPVIMISIGAIVFILEAFCGMRAAYGRYNLKNFGFKAPLAWLLQEMPAFLIPFGLMFYHGNYLFDRNNKINSNFILLCFFMIHYFNRSFIYTRRIQSDRRVNFLENGLAFIFCSVNGFQIGHYHTKYVTNSFLEWNFLTGSAIFLIGLFINIDSDNRLIKLRLMSKNTSEYKIPRGGAFEFVSAANYFGECFEWLGFALASWSLPALAFSLFTWANIGPRGYHHHLFYKEKFGAKYPPQRKALIPFLL